MEDLKRVLESSLNETLLYMIISGPRRKNAAFADAAAAREGRAPSQAARIRVRPLRKKELLLFQAASQVGKQEFHKNYTKEEALEQILSWMEGDYRQLAIETTEASAQALVSKKGKVTVKEKRKAVPEVQKADLSHNRKKRYILEEGKPVPFLVDLGVMTDEGKIVHARYDKFRQINRFLEFVEDVLPKLPKDRELTILDFGCGKSYLTFAVYYYLHELKGLAVNIVGLDLKEEVIAHCSRLAKEYGYENLRFQTGDIASYEGGGRVDMVITLHACDTATDYALEKAVEWQAAVILSVPCCQHELNQKLTCQALAPVLKYGLLRERMAALLTDGMRAAILEQAGYQVQVLEFIDMEHTPKNILIRAVRTGRKKIDPSYSVCRDFVGAEPLLGRLLEEKWGEDTNLTADGEGK